MAAADELQRVFKILSDPTRIRILRLLESEELVVQELMEVLGMAQSRVSRHLAILRDAGLLLDRREGTYVSYRFAPPAAGAWSEAWELVKRALRDDTTAQRDAAALTRVVEARSRGARSFFDAVGPEWDSLRKVFNDDVLRARAVARLVKPGLRVADIGTGTGVLALELARLGLRVVGVDRSERMLEATRAKLEEAGLDAERLEGPGPDAAGLGGVELRKGSAETLPLADAEVDAAFAHMLLHYVPRPGEVVNEMARVVRPGGVVAVVDFVRHDLEWMRQELEVTWLGFPLDDVRTWFEEAALGPVRIEVSQPPARGRELPATFIASARRP